MEAPPRSRRLGWEKRMLRDVNVSTEPGQVHLARSASFGCCRSPGLSSQRRLTRALSY
jgi:hypothetical protein